MSAGIEGGNPITSAARPREAANSTWGYYLFAGMAVLLGLILLNDWRYALAAQKRWTPAAGRVTENKVVVHRSRRSSSYNTFISYTYSANNALYGAGPLELNKYKLYFSEDGAWTDLRKHFPEGKSIDVYYNPANPYQSSLGLAGTPGLSVPIAFLLFAVVAVYMARQEE